MIRGHKSTNNMISVIHLFVDKCTCLVEYIDLFFQ